MAQMGEVLRLNDVIVSGRKDEVVQRISLCVERGVPPICGTCRRKRMKWNVESVSLCDALDILIRTK